MSLLKYESQLREPLIDGNKNYHQVTEDIIGAVEIRPGRAWWIGLCIALALLIFGVYSVYREVAYGIGQWNVHRTVGWGWAITNFVWWIGIGHAGTLISAILLLFGQKWRTGVNRAAEAMTIFAVMCAGMFPIFHVGRVWVAFYLFPYPNSRGPVWPNFNSALLWDVFAVSTYFTISVLFWYTGLLPDVASLRDRAKTKFRKMFYGLCSFGWTGSTKHWQRQESLALVLAGLATPLVLSVHTVVSFDFATSVIPGWHTTIFPPYFVAGAVFSGFAMVQTLLLITRKILHLEDYVTYGHIEAMNKIILVTGSIVGCAYLSELFISWYSMNAYEWWAYRENRANIFSPYGWAYYGMIFCNVISPQLFWSRKLRRNVTFTFFLAVLVNVGMWFERFVIFVTSIYRDYLPSSWATYYSPTIWEIGFYLGTFGLFFTCYFLFAKFFPVIAAAEIKAILKTSGENYKAEMSGLEEIDTNKFYTQEMEHVH